ncbi:hypothetical protein DASC09_014300 [Saccharomycopsis crataegensis]|uniref:Uncharacterized protein n=1 Tax=Saccharomycopsis crataegensis TaxID=43959 RepID=A0AAV5QGP8_9ASCO|nr:hypothetical protein DASC09_014300 [Saccharomycopsis crataegensis]
MNMDTKRLPTKRSKDEDIVTSFIAKEKPRSHRHRSPTKRRYSINMSQLEKCFEKFAIIDHDDYYSHNEVSSKEEPEQTQLLKHVDEFHQTKKLFFMSPSLILCQLQKQYNALNDRILRFPDKDSTVDELSQMSRLTITDRPRHNSKFVMKKSLTITEYNRLSVDVKFKICLNFIRYNIFKKFILDGAESFSVDDFNNIKNVLFYQIFKRFEKYYKVENRYLGSMNVSLEDKLKVIKAVENVYLGKYDHGYIQVEDRMLTDLYQ